MAEQESTPAVAPKEKKWTEWSVVSVSDGTLRCKRANVEDKKDAEYRQVPKPVFSPEEMAAMAEFASYGLLPSAKDLTRQCYDNRYRALAFRLCSELNTPASGEGK